MTDEPQNLDCQEALDRLYEYLDEELTPIRAEEVRLHIQQCAPCFELAGFEETYLRFLEARTRARGAPESLRKKILHEILFEDEQPSTT
jgi:anti-sigma factor (TIGR02949 family)